MSSSNVIKDLKSLSNPSKALLLQRYFKTGVGEYAEGDKFIGITVPLQRIVAKRYSTLVLGEVEKLLKSSIHEHRFTALEILNFQFEKADERGRDKIVKFYLRNKKYINNWDLVDTSASYILGSWLVDKDRSMLYKLASSKNLWDRRIAVISTQAFIKNNDFTDILKLARALMDDKHDLMHKAVGWMLREVGKKSVSTLEKFLNENGTKMPRTMLRYAIERFPESKRKEYLRRGQ